MYLRFVTWNVHPESRRPEGVFQAAYRLMDSEDLDFPVWEALSDEVAWFEKRLPVPPRHRFAGGAAISWFKRDAGECVRRLWGVVAALQDHGVPVEMVRTRRP